MRPRMKGIFWGASGHLDLSHSHTWSHPKTCSSCPDSWRSQLQPSSAYCGRRGLFPHPHGPTEGDKTRGWWMDEEEKGSRHRGCLWLFNKEKFAFQTRTRAPVTNRPHFDTHHHPQRQANKSFLWFYYPLTATIISDAGRRGGPSVALFTPLSFWQSDEMYIRCTSSSLPRQQSRWFDAMWKWRIQEGRVSSLKDWDQLVSMWRTAVDKNSK